MAFLNEVAISWLMKNEDASLMKKLNEKTGVKRRLRFIRVYPDFINEQSECLHSLLILY